MMKKLLCLILAVFLLAGCQAPVQETTAPTEATVGHIKHPDTEIPTLPTFPQGTEKAELLRFRNPGQLRLTYDGNRSSVRYITSVDQLPQEEALARYDQAFFEEHALVLVVETVSSGSMRLEIGALELREDTVTVKLDRAISGELGTSDMATWMLWVEVEQGLDYSWKLDSTPRLPSGEKY